MNSPSTNNSETPLWRSLLVFVAGIGVVLVLIYRLVSLQVLEVDSWTNQAIDNYKYFL